MRLGSCGVAVAAVGAVAMAGLARAGVEISEVMADNGKSVVTAGGIAGLDWVELRNTGSEAVDLSGWLVTDDPAKDASLWRPIGGAAVVPPGGTLVVFADSSFTDWSAADAHVAVGFSSNGESVVLAKPDGTVVDSLEFGEQMKDVSYGRVNATDAVLPRGAAAPRATALVAEDGKVRISLGNATKGVWYGYKFAERLEDLKDAEVIWLAEPATADGVLPLEHERTTTSGFYRIVVE